MSCLFGHDPVPSARWVQGPPPQRTLNAELWRFRICRRCRKITHAEDTGQRWETTGPK